MCLPFQCNVLDINMFYSCVCFIKKLFFLFQTSCWITWALFDFKTETDDYEAASRIQAGFRGYLERKEMTGNQASLFETGPTNSHCSTQLHVLFF